GLFDIMGIGRHGLPRVTGLGGGTIAAIPPGAGAGKAGAWSRRIPSGSQGTWVVGSLGMPRPSCFPQDPRANGGRTPRRQEGISSAVLRPDGGCGVGPDRPRKSGGCFVSVPRERGPVCPAPDG